MAVVFLLAHFDDEYCALPVIWQAQDAGEACWFLYVADYRDAANGAVRMQETQRFLATLGVAPEHVRHVGARSGVFDGSVCEGLASTIEQVRAELANLPGVSRLVTPAWEGGHPDHDSCAAMAALIGAERGIPVIQFGLYTGRRFPRPFYRACSPNPENGPTTHLALTPRRWLAWLAGVRFFPSQTWNWMGLWPAMFLTFASRGGFACQTLTLERVRARPHAGRLHYEWMFKTPYAQVRAAVDGLLSAPQPARGARIRKNPPSISP